MSLNENKLHVGNNDTIDSIKNDLTIYEDVKQIPITPYPSYIQYGLVMLCSEGSARVKVHTHEHLLINKELIILLPGQLVSINEISPDFKISAFSISQSLFNDVLSGIHRFSPHLFIYMRNHFHYKLVESESINFENYYKKSFYNDNYTKNAKRDLDLAIRQAYSFEDFIYLMKRLDYEIIFRANKISIRKEPYKRNIRKEKTCIK